MRENYWTVLYTEYKNNRKHYFVKCKCGYEGFREALSIGVL